MKKLILLFGILFISKVSFAGLVLEPYLGYQMGTAKTTLTSTYGGASGTSNDKGLLYGVRLGYSFLIPWVALDYSTYSGKDDASPTNDIKQSNLGLTVGAQMLPLIRPYAGYILTAKNESSGSTGTVSVKGTGIKVGLGFKVLPLLNINVEYATYTYKDIEGVSGASSVSDVYSEFKYTTTTVGLSYVF